MSQIIIPESFSEKRISKILNKEIKKYNNILIIAGKISLDKSTHIVESLPVEKNILKVWYGGECSDTNIKRLLKISEGVEWELVIGIGGGKSLDTAKIIGDILEIDIFTIPTIAATCANYTALSVMYNDDGSFDKLYFMKRPPKKTFIEFEIIYEAPKKYYLAGIGDTLAKYYEVFLKTEEQEINFNSTTGKKISELCRDIIITNVEKSFNELNENFKKVVECILLTTGKVSLLVDQKYNGAIAHSVCYGLTQIESIEKNKLHGEIVAYGLLLQLFIEDNYKEYEILKNLYNKIGLPTKLEHLCSLQELQEKEEVVLNGIMNSPNLDSLPIKVDKEIFRKILKNNINSCLTA